MQNWESRQIINKLIKGKNIEYKGKGREKGEDKKTKANATVSVPYNEKKMPNKRLGGSLSCPNLLISVHGRP